MAPPTTYPAARRPGRGTPRSGAAGWQGTDRLQARRKQTKWTRGGPGGLPSACCTHRRGRWGDVGTRWQSVGPPSSKSRCSLSRRQRLSNRLERRGCAREREEKGCGGVGRQGRNRLQTFFCGAQELLSVGGQAWQWAGCWEHHWGAHRGQGLPTADQRLGRALGAALCQHHQQCAGAGEPWKGRSLCTGCETVPYHPFGAGERVRP